MFKPCIIIPIYKHSEQFEKFAKRLPELPMILVDDGNEGEEKRRIKQISKSLKTELVVQEKNSGKIGAVIAGIKRANQKGYTHALQIDADGQHNPADIEKFLKLAENSPNALINGYPAYDDSVPKSRLHGRKITNFWVDIETQKGFIKDAMCGFRVYPLKETLKLIEKGIFFKKMGGDIEIIVKAYFSGIKIINVETKVVYPKDGFSNFRVFRDNIKISMLHTMLVSTMLINTFKKIFLYVYNRLSKAIKGK